MGSERNRGGRGGGGGERGKQQNDLGAANNKPYARTPGRFKRSRVYVRVRGPNASFHIHDVVIMPDFSGVTVSSVYRGEDTRITS